VEAVVEVGAVVVAAIRPAAVARTSDVWLNSRKGRGRRAAAFLVWPGHGQIWVELLWGCLF